MKECNDDCCPIVFDDGTTPDDLTYKVPTILYNYAFDDGEVYTLYNMAFSLPDLKALEAIHGKATHSIERKE